MTTARKRKAPPQRPALSRYGLVAGWDMSFFLRALGGKAVEGRALDGTTYLKVYGTLTEAVNAVSDFDFQLTGSASPQIGRSEIPSVGAIIGMRQAMQAGVELPLDQFNAVVAMACAGRLKSCHLSFQTPRYGSALISSISFSTSSPEE
jgi:hypothetical protein